MRIQIKPNEKILVVAPHPDHIAVYQAVKSRIQKGTKLYEYEVWTTLRKPDLLLDIAPVLEQKKAKKKAVKATLKRALIGIIGAQNYRRIRGTKE